MFCLVLVLDNLQLRDYCQNYTHVRLNDDELNVWDNSPNAPWAQWLCFTPDCLPVRLALHRLGQQPSIH